jgi:para-aminobenzoate synthetase component 1
MKLDEQQKTAKSALQTPPLLTPGTIWLDSSLTIHDKGYRSLFATNPVGELVVRGQTLQWSYQGKQETHSGDIWEQFSDLRNRYKGWWMGCISYEAMLPFLDLSPKTAHPFLPDLHFYLYESIVETKNEHDFIEADENKDASPIKSVSCSVTKKEYLNQVQNILRYIREGDIYQANVTTRFIVETALSPLTAYQQLRKLNPSPYGAFMNFGEYQILSSSPERMIAKRGSRLVTSPIKGTIARGNSRTEEDANRNRLLQSAKDQAELLMIVDLERNDIGQVAEIGSVTVDPLVRAEMYSLLIHLVSDVRGTLRSDCTVHDILAAVLPGGSITGAPKRRAVEILSEIEPVPRGVYTGCIGYLHGDDFEFNIAIRTMIHRNGQYHIHAGGGIVADSDPEAEYAEMQLKAQNLFRALGVEGV